MKIRFLALCFLAMLPAAAQQLVRVDPDCPVNGAAFAFSAAAQTLVIDNRQSGCSNWTVTYDQVAAGALQIELQSAPNVGGVPGTWVTFAGSTIIQGANPSTATPSGIIQLAGFQPFVRVISDSQSANILGFVFGSRSAASAGAAPVTSPCPGTTTTPCVVDGPDAAGAVPTKSPVQVSGFDGTDVQRISTDTGGRLQPAGTQVTFTDGISNTQDVPNALGGPAVNLVFPTLFNGTTWDRELKCPNTKIVDDSTMGNIQQIALSGTTQIYICKVSLTTAAGVSIQLTQGTGANCAAGTSNLSGLYQNVAAIAEDFLADQSPLISVAGNAVCLNLSAGVRATGQFSYAQF
jgi:hypothetical protein